MMSEIERLLFIALLEERGYESGIEKSSGKSAFEVAYRLGIKRDIAQEILKKWWIDKGIWDYGIMIQFGWFELANLKGPYKKIYKKCLKENINFVEPILEKSEPHGFDNKEITWYDFLELRNTAKVVANKCGYPVYLVGSSLSLPIPRDIDVSVILPVRDYIKKFGNLPTKQEEFAEYLGNVFRESYEMTSELHHCLSETHHVDIKVCPDVWWKNKDKMLLAEPKKGE